MSAKIISILLAVVIATASLESARHIESQYVPISNRYPGIDLTIPNSSITIELVYDATCKILITKVVTAQSSIRFGSKWSLHWLNLSLEKLVISMPFRYFLTEYFPSKSHKPSDMSTISKAQRKHSSY